MLSLRIGPLLAPLSVWRRPLSVDTCPPMMACRRFGALEQPPRLSSCSSYMSTALISGVMTRPKSRARRGKSRAAARSPGGSNLPKLTCYVLTFSSSAHTRRTSRGAPLFTLALEGLGTPRQLALRLLQSAARPHRGCRSLRRLLRCEHTLPVSYRRRPQTNICSSARSAAPPTRARLPNQFQSR